MPTNSEKIDDLLRRMTQIETRLEERTTQTRRELDALQSVVAETEESLVQLVTRSISLEERIKSLEKHSDRTWQVWLALGAAITALLVAFLKK